RKKTPWPISSSKTRTTSFSFRRSWRSTESCAGRPKGDRKPGELIFSTKNRKPMKVYDNKNWSQFLFSVTKSDTLLKLAPMIAFILVYSLGVSYLEINYFKVSSDSWVRNLPPMHSLLSFVISMLLVFRTNTAYDRWWEGRKLWGQLVNNSRNLAIKVAAMVDPADEEVRKFFRRAIPIY